MSRAGWPFADAAGVHLVHRRADVDRAGVDEVEDGRDGERGRRGRRPLALLDEGVGHDAVEGGEEDGLVERGPGERHRRVRPLGGGPGGAAGGVGAARLALDAVEDVGRDEAVLREPRVRSRSRPARSAARQAWSRWASAALLSSPARRSWACCSASSTRRRISPFRTRVPRRWGRTRTRPPVSGASLARRRAFTVPAREFVTVSSTRPFSAATTRTGTGAGAKTVKRRRTTTATRTARSARRGQSDGQS